MKSIQISLQMAVQVKKFVNIVQNYSFDIDLRSDRYIVDAKSVLGIFSLDLSNPVNVEIHASDAEQDKCDELISCLQEFAI